VLPAALIEVRDVRGAGTTVLAILNAMAAMAGTLEHVVQLAE
jgi:bifunctional ADP-heptose synthase (sugar kinase/adenylyltransferase)